MKKILTLITLSAIAVTTASALLLAPDDPNNPPTAEQLEMKRQWQEQERQRLERQVKSWARVKAGDDDALKEHMFDGIFTQISGYRETVQWYTSGEHGISRERVLGALDSIICESLPIIDEWMSDESNRASIKTGNFSLPQPASTRFRVSLLILDGAPGEDVLALFEKYLALCTTDVYRSRITEFSNRMKEAMQKPKKQEEQQETPPTE